MRSLEDRYMRLESAFEVLRAFISTRSELTQRAYKLALTDFMHFLGISEDKRGEKVMLSAKPHHAMCYVESMQTRTGQDSRAGGSNKLGAATIRHRIIVLRTFYKELQREGLTENNPFDCRAFDHMISDRTQKRPTQMLAYEDVMKLVEAPSSGSKEGIRDRAIMAMLFGGGLRRQEVENLRIGDIKLLSKGMVSLVLRDTKNGTDAIQGLPKWACEHVLNLYRQRLEESGGINGYLCTEYFGLFQTSSERRLGTKQLYRIFKAWCAHIGLSPNITPHSARATAITMLLDQGIPHREVRKFSRHASIAMVERYDKRRDDEAQEVARCVDYKKVCGKK